MPTQVRTDLDFGGVAKISGLQDGTNPQDAVTVAQLNSAVEGLAWKDSCRVATQSNVTIASPGATVDGISMVANDRVLVRSQTTQSENGIYIWNGAATPLTRALDANTAAELEQAVTTVEEGTSAGTTFRQTTVSFTLGTGNVVWTTFGTSVPAASETTAGIAEIATQAEADGGTDDLRFITPLKLANLSSRFRRASADIGDGTNTSYTVTHNFNSFDVQVQVFLNSGNRDNVICDIRRSSVNAVVLVFNTAPTSNQYRVVVQY